MSASALEVGKALVARCKEGNNLDAIRELYAQDVVSVEAGSPDAATSREVRGLEAVLGKSQWWRDNHEVHSAHVGGPGPHDDRFITTFTYDVTMKATGQRFTMEEAALYTVKDGKITREEFFYHMG